MNGLRTAGLALVSLLWLAACGSDDPAPPPREEDRALERAIQEPLDRARAVEEEMEKARREQDAKLREQEG
jgi:hypothetical protein